MRKFNFLSKSSSRSCSHNVVTLASTVGSQEEFYVSGGNSRGAFTPTDVCQTSSVRLNRFTAHRRGTMLKLISVLVLILTIGVGNVWGAENDPHDFPQTISQGLNKCATFSDIEIAEPSYPIKSVIITYAYNKTNSPSATVSIGSTEVDTKVFAGTGNTTTYESLTFTPENAIKGAVTIVHNSGSSCSGTGRGTLVITNVRLVEGAATGPSITTSVNSLSDFTYSSAGVPNIKTFNVSGTNLTNNVTVTPPSGYEICKTENGTYTDETIELSKGTGTLAATTIYVKLKSDLSAGNKIGNIVCASTGVATSKNVALAGSVPFKVTWQANGQTHATTYVAYAANPGTEIGTFPDDPDPDDYTCSGTNRAFYGWYNGASYKNANTAPDIITTSTKITTDKTFNAVFADASGGGSTTKWVLTALDAVTEGTYALVNQSNYAFNGSFSSGHGCCTSSAFSFSNGEATSAPSGTCEVVFEAVTGGFKMKMGNNYLYATKAGSGGFDKHSTETSYWKYASSNWTYNSNSAYLRSSDNATTGFRTYGNNSGDGVIKLAKKTTVSTTSYSNYMTTCCSNLGQINGSVNWTNGEATVSWDAAGGFGNTWALQYKKTTDQNYSNYNGSIGTADSRCSNSAAIDGLEAGIEYKFRITGTSDGSVTCAGAFEEIKTATVPKINTPSPTSLSNLGYSAGSNPTPQDITISGSALVAGTLTIQAPANIQVSVDGGTSWSASAGSKTIDVEDGPLSNTTIKVRMAPDLSENASASGNVTISGGGAASQTVAVSGTVTSACAANPSIGEAGLKSGGAFSLDGVQVAVADMSPGSGTCEWADYGFVWGTEDNKTANKVVVGTNGDATEYYATLAYEAPAKFVAGTTYYFSAYGKNSKSGAAIVYGDEASFTPYTVSYNNNDGAGSITTQVVNTGGSVTLPSSGMTKDYCTLAGWTLNSTSGTSYNKGDTYSSIGANATFYAVWANIPVEELTLNHSSLKRYVDESNVTLSVTDVTPATANPAVTWSSSDPTVASVTDAGVVAFLKAGTATITATSNITGSIKATCAVEVRAQPVPTMEDEDGNTISGDGLSATWANGTRTLTASEGTSLYKFMNWVVTGATPNDAENMTTTLGDPSDAVTVKAVFYKPVTVTWQVGSGNATTGTTEVKYGTQMKDLTLPTDVEDDDLEDCGTNKFMGWSASELKGTGHDAPADLFTEASGETEINADKTFYAVFANVSGGGASAGTTMWAETWTDAVTSSGNGTPTKDDAKASNNCSTSKGTTIYGSASITYDQTDENVYCRNESNTAGSAPELLLTSGKTWTISGIPTGGATTLTLTFKTNKTSLQTLTVSTDDEAEPSMTGSITSGTGTYTITTDGASTIDLTFGNNANTRLDDIEVAVATAGTTTSDYQTNCCIDPGKPTGLALTSATTSTLAVSWSSASNASQYKATLYNDAACTEEATATTNPITVSTTSATFEGLSESTSYYFTVQSIGNGTTYCADGPVSDPSAKIQTTSSKTLSSIAVTTNPRLKYVAGETLDLEGMVVTATYSDESTDDVTASCTFLPTTSTALTTENTSVSVSYSEKNTSFGINVYGVTMQAKDEDGNAIATGGPSAPSRTNATSISPSADAGNYVFKEWAISGAKLGSSASTKTNTITDPESAVTVTAKYYKPRVVKWSVNGNDSYATGNPTTAVGYNGPISDVPTNPSGLACAGTFVGWTDVAHNNGQTAKDDDSYYEDALYKEAGDFPNITAATTTFYAVFAEQSNSDGYKYIGDAGTLADGKKYIFVDSKTAGSAHALKATDLAAPNSSNNGTAVAVTVTSTAEGVLVTTVNTDLEFEYVSSGTKLQYEVAGPATRYLFINGDGVGMKSDDNRSRYTTDAGLQGWNNKVTTYYDVYYNSTSDKFEREESADSRVYAFIKQTPTYSNYVTECNQNLVSVTYNENGGSTTCAGGSHDKTTNYTICATEPTRDYYTFAGWLCSADDETYGASETIDKDAIDADFTLTAQWTPITYNITYVLDGGTNGANPATYNVETATFDLADATKDNHDRFDGWYTDNGVWSNKVESITQGSHDDITLYAKWATRHMIEFDVNGVITTIYRASDENIGTAVAGMGSAPTPTAPSLCGKVFAGWSENVLEEETDTKPADLMDNATGTVIGNKYYYAVWATSTTAPGPVTVFEDNLNISGTGTPVNSREGWKSLSTVFSGNGSARLSSTSASGSMTIDKALTAGKEYTITFDAKAWNSTENGKVSVESFGEGGTFSPANITVTDYSNWTPYTVTLTNVLASTEITFSGAEDYRIYIKNVKVTTIDDVTTHSKYTTACHVTADNENPVNVTADNTISSLTVKQDGTVNLDANLIVNDFTIEAMEGHSGQVLNPNNLQVNGNAYYDLTLNASGTMNHDLWYAFAVPFQVDAATGIQRLSNDGVASPAGFNSHYVLLKYNSAAYASAGEGWEYVTAGETLMPGKFYMIALNSNAYNRVRMTKKAGAAVNNKADLTLSLVGTGVHANWNALANNALAYANVSATGDNADLKVQVYNSINDNYTPYAYNKVTFTVGTPFFLQAAEAGTMSVNIAASNNETVKAPQREAVATEEFQIRLGENTESYYDILYVSASDEALNEYQIGHDLAKAGVSTSVPQMYVPAYGSKLCDAEFPLVNNEATFPLTFTAPNAGTYQVYVAEAAQDAELYLLQNNSIVWNLTLSPYEIALPQGTTEGYSLLLKAKAPNTATGVDEINASEAVQKVIIDEKVYILRGGKMYGVDGKEVR